MNKIPNFFRKSKTQAGEEVQSPTKDILTPAELDKLKNKIRKEIAAAELRIAYILNRQDRPKPGDKKEIEERETDIKNLRTKYHELLDPEITVYFAKKKQAEPLTTETLTTAEPLIAAEPLITAEPLTAAKPLTTEPVDQAPPIQCRSSYRTTWCGGPIPEWFYNQDRDHSATFRQRYLSFLKASLKFRHVSTYNINKINPYAI